jgi:hypothetical protein
MPDLSGIAMVRSTRVPQALSATRFDHRAASLLFQAINLSGYGFVYLMH